MPLIPGLLEAGSQAGAAQVGELRDPESERLGGPRHGLEVLWRPGRAVRRGPGEEQMAAVRPRVMPGPPGLVRAAPGVADEAVLDLAEALSIDLEQLPGQVIELRGAGDEGDPDRAPIPGGSGDGAGVLA